MYSREAFNPFWVGQLDSSFGHPQMAQHQSDYNSFGDSGIHGYNRSDVGGRNMIQSEYTYNGDYEISDGNDGHAYNKAYDVGRFTGGAEGVLEGGFNSRLEGGSVAEVQQGRPTRTRGSYFSFGYDNSSSPISYMR